MKRLTYEHIGGEIETPIPYVTIHHKKFRERNIFIFRMHRSIDVQTFFLRAIEFNQWELFRPGRPLITDQYNNWFYIINYGKPYGKSFYGSMIEHDRIFNFLKQYFKYGFTVEEMKWIKILTDLGICDLNENGIVRTKNKNAEIIIINEEMCKQFDVDFNDVLYHELGHVLYQYDWKYRKKINSTYRSLNDEYKNHVNEHLSEAKYDRSDFANEWGSEIICSSKIRLASKLRFLNPKGKINVKEIKFMYHKLMEEFINAN